MNTINFANYLGCNLQYMDVKDEKNNLIEEVPIENYEKYKYDFQTSIETEDKYSGDIFIDFLIKEK